MDWPKLTDELAKDPLGRGYAGMTAVETLASLTALDRQTRAPIKANDLYKLLLRRGSLARARLLAQDANLSFDLRVACLTAADALAAGAFSDFDLDDPAAAAEFNTYLGALQAAGAVPTDEQAAEILALADKTVSREEELGGFGEALNTIDEGRMAKARVHAGLSDGLADGR